MVSNTGAASETDRLMTFRTLAVAVCLLQRLPGLVEQPGVLDRDDAPGRAKVLRQRDLSLGIERSRAGYAQPDEHADALAFAHASARRSTALSAELAVH